MDLAELLTAIERYVPQLLDEPERAARIVAACREALEVAEPDEPFADAVARIERAAHTHSRHLLLFVDSRGELVPDTADHGWPPPDIKEVRRRGGGVTAVSRSDDHVVTLRVDSLEPFDVAEDQIDAAITLTGAASGVILDLRRNGGGDPASVARLAGFVLGGPSAPLSTVHQRQGSRVEWATDPPAAGLCVPPEVPVAVLLSARTFSSAEALAYHLSVRGRVRTFGQRTPGAADHVSPFVLTRHVHAQLPVARVVDAVTGTSWEGNGVAPDEPCDAEQAHDLALAWIRRR